MKKSIALFLALCLCLGLLAGCGSGPASAPSAETASEEASAEAPASEAAPAAEAEPEEAEAVSEEASESEEAPEEASAEDAAEASDGYDTYTGAIPASESSVTYPIEDAGVELTFWTPFQSNMPGVYDTITDIPTLQVIADEVGVTVDWTVVSGMEMFTQFNLMAAGGDYCDMIEAAVECYSGGAIGALDDGVLTDLTDYIEENAPDYLEAHESRGSGKDILTGDGRYACLWGCYNLPEVSQGYVIRQDWLDELGLEVPTTYDEWFDVLSAFKDKYGCSNAFLMDDTCQDDQHTPAGFGTPGYKSNMFGSGSDLYQVDGVVKTSFLEEGYRDYLREMHRWFEAGLFSADFPTISSRPNDDNRVALINNGGAGIWAVGASNVTIQQDEIVGGAKLTGIPDPLSDNVDFNHFSSAMTVNSQCDVAISSTCENIEACLQYLNYYFTDEGIRYYNYGVEGQTYNMVDGKVEYTDLIMNPVAGYTPFTMTEAYVLVGGIASVTYGSRQLDFAGEEARQAWETWNSTQDRLYVLPEGLALTAEESSQASALMSDIYTYAAQCAPQFILGTMDIENDWDAFTQSMRDMGIEDILAIYQTALDRYNAL